MTPRSMVLAIVQLVLLPVAGFLLFLLWRRYVAGKRFAFLVTTGFFMRALVGQALFWISYLELPLLRSLQVGRGMWFFAMDAGYYLHFASTAANGGLRDIIFHQRGIASVTYVQILSLFSMILGHGVGTGLLLNLFAYLGMCAIALRWSAQADAGEPFALRVRAVVLAALCLSPAAMLWAFQPLKDTVFQFLLVAFFAAAALWRKQWMATARRTGMLWAAGTALVLTLLAIAGVRWYVAFFLLGLTGGYLALIALRTKPVAIKGVVAAIFLFVALTQAFRIGAGPYLPGSVSTILTPKPDSWKRVADIGGMLSKEITTARSGFERAGGATTIVVQPAPREERLSATPLPMGPGVATGATQTVAATGATRPDAPARPDSTPPAETRVAVEAPTETAMPAEVVSSTAMVALPTGASTSSLTPATRSTEAAPGTSKGEERVELWPEPAAAADAVAPALMASSKGALPTSRAGRMLAGGVATLVPQTLAQKFGLIQIGGGRGLMWFTDFDTLFIDLILLAVLVLVAMRVRPGRAPNALFWLLVLAVLALTPAMVYTVTNFGTLFRLRGMIFTLSALIPLALLAPPQADRPENEVLP